jgi:hypothetical protein
MSEHPSSRDERRKRLDLLIDLASMLSFPASDPPALLVEEPEPPHDESATDDDVLHREQARR